MSRSSHWLQRKSAGMESHSMVNQRERRGPRSSTGRLAPTAWALVLATLALVASAGADCTGQPVIVGGYPPPSPLVDPAEVMFNGETRAENYATFVADLYDQTANPNVTRVLLLDGELRQAPPWFIGWLPVPGEADCATGIADTFLHEGYGVTDATLDPANYLVNGDELSELALVTSMSTQAEHMLAIYRTFERMQLAAYSGLPCWLLRVQGDSITCAAADTATDVSARLGLAFLRAARNPAFSATDRDAYLTAGLGLASAHLAHEYKQVTPPCPVSPLDGREMCHYLAGGGETAASSGEMWVGYFQDAAMLLLAAYAATGDTVYLDRATDVVEQFGIANGFVGPGPAFACVKFGWVLPPGGTPSAAAIGCPFACDGDPVFVWDDSDAPRALWTPNALRAHHLTTLGAALPPAYATLLSWTMAVLQTTGAHTDSCSCLQYSSDGASLCNCGPGHFELGLGIGLQLYAAPASVETTLDNAMSHFLWAERRWDTPAHCFFVYRGVRTVKALAAAIGLDEALYTPAGLVFADGFESGTTGRWSLEVP